ncbi:helix-turn-helix domain-containing protein [Williamsia serinedens]|uniref:helix-turn-helix domain-containing protein n=1 Tax=Williamsia serinedens TaxID=391736 RepID=UPI002FE7B0C3
MSELSRGPLRDELAARVKNGLKNQQETQRDLARRMGVSEKHISQVLTGRAGATVEMWDRMLTEVGQ